MALKTKTKYVLKEIYILCIGSSMLCMCVCDGIVPPPHYPSMLQLPVIFCLFGFQI